MSAPSFCVNGDAVGTRERGVHDAARSRVLNELWSKGDREEADHSLGLANYARRQTARGAVQPHHRVARLAGAVQTDQDRLERGAVFRLETGAEPRSKQLVRADREEAHAADWASMTSQRALLPKPLTLRRPPRRCGPGRDRRSGAGHPPTPANRGCGTRPALRPAGRRCGGARRPARRPSPRSCGHRATKTSPPGPSATLLTPPNSSGDPASVRVLGPIDTTGMRRAGGGVPVLVTWMTPLIVSKVVAKSLGGAEVSGAQAVVMAAASIAVATVGANREDGGCPGGERFAVHRGLSCWLVAALSARTITSATGMAGLKMIPWLSGRNASRPMLLSILA